MTFVALLPVVLCALTLTAHFLRNGHFILAALTLAIPLLLFVRRRWVVRYAQVALAIGTLEWSRAAGALLHERMLDGKPYLRMLLIMYGVAAATAASIFAFRNARLRERYGLGAPRSGQPATGDTTP